MMEVKNSFSKPNNNITYYLDPNYIYVPINKVNVLENDYIYKLGSIGNNISSVSGKVIGVKRCNVLNTVKKTIVVENDFREYTLHEDKKMNINIPNLLKLLENDKELFNKFKSNKTFDNIVIKAYSNNNFEYNEVFLLKENLIDILDFINKLSLLYKSSSNMLVVKSNDAYIIDECLNTIGTYPNITLSVVNSDIVYENNTLVLSTSEIIKIYNLFKGNIKTTKLITITGDNIKDSKVIRIKINTLLKDVIDKFIDIVDNNYYVVGNSLLNGFEIKDISNFIISEDVTSIYIMKKNTVEVDECIKCGKCLDICQNKDKCHKCGMCSYICPVNRDVKTKSFIHKKSLKEYVISYILCLIPLYLYGLYKNGILLYNKDLISIFMIPKILYFLIIGLISYFITNKILKKELKFDLLFLSLFVVPLFLPVNLSLWLYFIIMFIALLFRKFYNITYIVLILSLFKSFLNKAEVLGVYSFSILDLLMGRNISGIGISSIALVSIIALILSKTNIYKLEISLSSLLSFIVLTILFKDYNYFLIGNIYGGLLILAPWSNITPMKRREMLYYGIFIGITTFIFTKFINLYYGVFIALALGCTLYYFIDKYKIFAKIKLGRKSK